MGKKSKALIGKGAVLINADDLTFPSDLLASHPPGKLAYQEPETLLKDYVWVLRDFFAPNECRNWIEFMESCGGRLDHMQQRGTRFLASRECYRYSLDDDKMAQRLWERIKATKLMNELPDRGNAVACNPNIRLYKYEPGMSFGKHIDESQCVRGVGVTRLTVLIYLSQCGGGATRFGDTPTTCCVFHPATGAILLHVHGEECLEHEGEVVTSGTKYVLRTDLVYKVDTK